MAQLSLMFFGGLLEHDRVTAAAARTTTSFV
jgi:hypothetical protein